MLLQRPTAGSQVPFCPIDKKILDSWSHIDPCTFKVRGENYFRYDNSSRLMNKYKCFACTQYLHMIKGLQNSMSIFDSGGNICTTSGVSYGTNFLYGRDKKKELAPNYAAYYPFGVDVYLSPRKINHVARFVELPVINSSGILPPILVVNAQVCPLFTVDFTTCTRNPYFRAVKIFYAACVCWKPSLWKTNCRLLTLFNFNFA